MRCQVELAFGVEAPFYARSAEWCSAQRVLDLGCGTGDYLAALRALFPSKEYTGVERDPGYVALARQRLGTNGFAPVPVVQGDLFAFSGRFDAVIARLVVQHLPEPERIFDVARGLLTPAGTLIVVESVDSERCFMPVVPEIEEMFARFRARRRAAGFDRDAGLRIVQRAPDHGFRLCEDTIVFAPSSVGRGPALFVETYATVFGILRAGFDVDYDFVSAERALHAWSGMPGAYAHIGVHLASYGRVA
jgi:SAM-dependent methyltransferase